MDKSLENKIKLIWKIKKFGQEKLGLNLEDAFNKYADLKEFGWLYVTPEDKLKSIFFLQPFRFYKNIKKLEKEFIRYSKKGFDTHKFLGEAVGHKTCPITQSLLDTDIVRQAFVILHEGWHMTNQSVHNSLEESTGNIVGFVGTGLFLEKYYQDFKIESENQRREFKCFSKFVMKYYTLLEEAFESKDSDFKKKEKLKILDDAGEERDKIVEQINVGWVKYRFNQELNNAYFQRYHIYSEHYDLADRVYQKIQNLPKSIEVFKESLKRKDGLEYLNTFLKK